jgi:hypothetical protein
LTSKKKGALAVLLITIIALVVVVKGGLIPQLGEIGYLTASQGLEAEFHSIRWGGLEGIPQGTWWSRTEIPPPLYETGLKPPHSQMAFGYELAFDPDAGDTGMPDLCASQQPFTLDTDYEPKRWIWQVKVDSRTAPNGTKYDVYEQFEMYRYKMTWAINVWLSGSSWESDGHIKDDPFAIYMGCRGVYYNLELWIKLRSRNFLYFDKNPDQLFIAPAYLGVDEVHFIGTDDKGTKILDDGDIAKTIDMIPKARGETLGIYYNRGATEVVNLENKVLQYQGFRLDPAVFRTEYWTRIILNVFKAYTWVDWGIWYHYKYPSVNIKFYVYVLVVGKWTVYIKTGEVPALEGHQPITNATPPWWEGLAKWWNTNWWWIITIGILIIVLLVTVLNPGLWAALAARRGSGSSSGRSSGSGG